MEINELLRRTRVEVAPETYNLIGLRHEAWLKLLENPELSPRMSAPFMIFKDKFETTLLIDEIDFETLRHAVRDAKVERGFRLITFDIELDFTVVGFLSRVSGLFADAGISIVAVSSFSRDHLLVKQDNLGKALQVLSPFVDELC